MAAKPQILNHPGNQHQPDKTQRWKIGEVAQRSGVGIETLRYYEKLGLLGHPARTSSGYRLYESGILERLDFIKHAQLLGFSLSEIGRIISEREHGHSPCANVREIVRQRLQEVDEKLKQLRRYRNELAAALAEWDQVGERPGHVCGLIEEFKETTKDTKNTKLKSFKIKNKG